MCQEHSSPSWSWGLRPESRCQSKGRNRKILDKGPSCHSVCHDTARYHHCDSNGRGAGAGTRRERVKGGRRAAEGPDSAPGLPAKLSCLKFLGVQVQTVVPLWAYPGHTAFIHRRSFLCPTWVLGSQSAPGGVFELFWFPSLLDFVHSSPESQLSTWPLMPHLALLVTN